MRISLVRLSDEEGSRKKEEDLDQVAIRKKGKNNRETFFAPCFFSLSLKLRRSSTQFVFSSGSQVDSEAS